MAWNQKALFLLNAQLSNRKCMYNNKRDTPMRPEYDIILKYNSNTSYSRSHMMIVMMHTIIVSKRTWHVWRVENVLYLFACPINTSLIRSDCRTHTRQSLLLTHTQIVCILFEQLCSFAIIFLSTCIVDANKTDTVTGREENWKNEKYFSSSALFEFKYSPSLYRELLNSYRLNEILTTVWIDLYLSPSLVANKL